VNQGRYIRYRDKTKPCARCKKPHGVLSMRFDMERAVEDASRKLAAQIDAEILAAFAK
jgi:hypothetical protein